MNFGNMTLMLYYLLVVIQFKLGGKLMKLKIENSEEPVAMEEPADKEEVDLKLRYAKKELSDKLGLILEEYQDQKQGVEAKIKKMHSDMYVAIVIFLAVFLIDAFFTFLLKQPGGSLLAFTWEMWVACVAVFIAMWKSGINMLKKIAEYHIHNETGVLRNYRIKHGVFTLKDEGRYCETKAKETQKLLAEVMALTKEDSYDSYYEIQYMEKRADTRVFGVFDDYAVLWYILMAVVFLIIFVIF